MSKKFTMTLLSSSLAGLLVMSGGVSAQEQEEKYTVPYATGNNKWGNTYEVVKTGDNGNFRYEVKEKENGKRTLFTFDSNGDVIINGSGITYTIHDGALNDFARAAEKKKNGQSQSHRMTDSVVRDVYNKVYSLQRTKITGFSVEDGENGKVSLGSDAKASGEFSVAVGNGAKATEKASTSVGSWSAALGQQSVALGVGTYAYANASTALGSVAFVDNTATYGTAAGNRAKVDKDATEGTALGAKATVTNKNSVALGANSVTTRDNEVYIGYKTGTESDKTYGTRVLGGLSDGTRNSDAATVGQLNRKVGGVYDDVKARITVESEKQKKYTDQKTSEVNEKVEARTTVGVDSDGKLTRAEGATKTIAVNDGLVALSGRTDRIDYAVGAIDGRVTRNTQSIEKNSKAIAANTRTLQQHSARLDSQQRQINENHKEMKRAAAQSAALTGLFQPYSVGKFNATAAVGGYSDQQALAVGVGYRFNEQTAAKAGVAFSDGDASWNVGVNFEF
ncbi:TPA: YadA-like family protein [Escherichia coli]|uniref:YadA-like family protein n=1 Tax=Escherichia coli TaxID=562 RepID=UPI0010CB46D4|nr:YadA-like family protein [Escherichia coli]GCZ03635.1 hypothetical protein HmCmsJML173_03174 [Escherichia coli]HDV9556890.1 YadA-like family protein [Escherichia coli]